MQNLKWNIKLKTMKNKIHGKGFQNLILCKNGCKDYGNTICIVLKFILHSPVENVRQKSIEIVTTSKYIFNSSLQILLPKPDRNIIVLIKS